MTLAAGRVAHRAGVANGSGGRDATAGAALALLTFAADAADARAARDAARLAAQWLLAAPRAALTGTSAGGASATTRNRRASARCN